MSGESAAAIAKDMRAWRYLQTLAGFAAIRYETAVLHLVESAIAVCRGLGRTVPQHLGLVPSGGIK